MYCIEDYGLTAAQLEAKYENRGYHPQYWHEDHLASGVDMPYWDWVQAQLVVEQTQLDKDSPFNVGEL